jgi:predicted Zn-dependent peptidase
MLLSYHTLDNGIRLVHHRTNGMVAHCGLLISTGSRDESAAEHGMVHFIEHMLFKGTGRRKAYHILSCLDDRGGELNAYTTKEETAIHASVLKEDLERAVDLICDISFNSTFPEKELEKEKEVITEEIKATLDNPSELIFDEFEELIFPSIPLGRSILGTPETVKAFTRQDLVRFVSANYSTDQMVFCSVGNIPEEKIIRIFRKYFDPVTPKTSHKKIIKRGLYKPATEIRYKETNQNHCIVGNLSFGLKHKNRIGMFLLNNILGGPVLNSRLNLSLRERNGYAYSIESGYNAFRDTGIFSVYFGTESHNLEKCLAIIRLEMNKLRHNRLGAIQLSRAKNQIKGSLARAYENHESLMLSLAKNLLVFNRIDSLETVCKKIDNLNASHLLEIANEAFEPEELSTLIYK